MNNDREAGAADKKDKAPQATSGADNSFLDKTLPSLLRGDVIVPKDLTQRIEVGDHPIWVWAEAQGMSEQDLAGVMGIDPAVLTQMMNHPDTQLQGLNTQHIFQFCTKMGLNPAEIVPLDTNMKLALPPEITEAIIFLDKGVLGHKDNNRILRNNQALARDALIAEKRRYRNFSKDGHLSDLASHFGDAKRQAWYRPTISLCYAFNGAGASSMDDLAEQLLDLLQGDSEYDWKTCRLNCEIQDSRIKGARGELKSAMQSLWGAEKILIPRDVLGKIKIVTDDMRFGRSSFRASLMSLVSSLYNYTFAQGFGRVIEIEREGGHPIQETGSLADDVQAFIQAMIKVQESERESVSRGNALDQATYRRNHLRSWADQVRSSSGFFVRRLVANQALIDMAMPPDAKRDSFWVPTPNPICK